MITYLTDPALYSEKEAVYLRARKLEGRIYSDSEVMQLPDISLDHPLRDEWKIRQRSYSRLKNKLEKRKTRYEVLDLGCGNGWMSNHLSENRYLNVTGVDLNQFELQQADRVFKDRSNLKFIYGNVMDHIFPSKTFDIIILAASIQYFPDLKNLLKALLPLLRDRGEIHVIDSPLYTEQHVDDARKRSQAYYDKLGVGEMSKYYFHHEEKTLVEFNHTILNRSFIDLIALHFLRYRSLIFPWIVIRNTL